MPASLYGWSGPSLLTFVLSLSLSCSRNELRRPDPYFSILALGSIWIRISRHGSQLRTFFDESLIAVPPTQRRGRMGRRREKISLSVFSSHFRSHLTMTFVDWDGGIALKRIFLGCRIQSRSPRRRNKSKTPRWPLPLGGYAHEVVMGWRDWRLGRPWPTVTAWARSRFCWRYF